MYSFALLRCFLPKSSARTLSFPLDGPSLCHGNLFSSSARVILSIKYWTPEEDQKLLALHQQGLRAQEIASQMQNRNRGQVHWRLRALRENLTPFEPVNTWKPQEDAILLENLRAGLSLAQIARNLPGRTRNAIQTRSWYVYPGRSGRAWTVAEKQRVIDLVMTERLPFKDVAQALQRPLSSVYKVWYQTQQGRDLLDTPGIRWSPADKQRVLDMRGKDGQSLEVIAKALGRSVKAVSNVWQRHGRPNLPDDIYTGPTRANDWTRKDDETLTALCDEGLSWREISLRFPNRNHIAVSRRAHLLRLNGTRERPSRVKMIAIKTALRGVLDGTATYDEVASKFEPEYQRTVERALYNMRRKLARRGISTPPEKRTGGGEKSP